METQRLFIALQPPPVVAEALAELEEPIRGAVWIAAEKVHLTMRFLGDTPVDQLAGLREALAAVDVGSFVLTMEGVGAFPRRGGIPHVLWAGVGQADPRLFQLRQRIDDALLSVNPGLDVRQFHPHFTMARLHAAAPGAVAQFLRRHRAFAAPPFRVEAFHLMASERDGDAIRYVALASFRLPPSAEP